ncbi:hypothetical protein F2P81_012536 [Scophthalmus maximus]|uniref:Uncharacterized protein n=1 Tax=Scophthalmus maximus TaxID=52904 RepID=A0A6A4SRN3_SCOMX|nr:hypothetical protein F2P81_012536 [Scophthalmus maximus]
MAAPRCGDRTIAEQRRPPASTDSLLTDEVVTLTDGGMWMEDSLVTAHQPLRPIRQVSSDGEPCVMFQARKLSLRYEKQRQLDLTERAFSPQKPVDTSQSACSLDKATYVHATPVCLE